MNGAVLSGRVALVTGAGRGIGRSTALALANRGVKVALSARSAAELEEVRAEIGELKQLAMQAKAVETSGVEAKLSRLKNLMQEQGFFDHPEKRLLLFTEFKDTLEVKPTAVRIPA